jgi:hypothetical protein
VTLVMSPRLTSYKANPGKKIEFSTTKCLGMKLKKNQIRIYNK